MEEIHQIQIEKKEEKAIFDDLEELFETHSVHYRPENPKDFHDHPKLDELNPLVKPKKVSAQNRNYNMKNPSFNDMSIIQTGNPDLFKG